MKDGSLTIRFLGVLPLHLMEWPGMSEIKAAWFIFLIQNDFRGLILKGTSALEAS